MNDCRVIWKASFESRLRFGRLTDANIFDVGTSKDDILVNFVSWGDGTISWSIFGTERSDWKKESFE